MNNDQSDVYVYYHIHVPSGLQSQDFTDPEIISLLTQTRPHQISGRFFSLFSFYHIYEINLAVQI